MDICASVARLLATVCCDVLRIRADVTEDNLRHAFPAMSHEERRRLTWRMWEHLFLMVVEVIQAPRKVHHSNWRDYVTLHRSREMIRAFFDDRPTVIVCGHYGNFEFSGYMLGILGFPSFTIARPLDNPFLDRFLNNFRASTGGYILPKNGSAAQIEEVLAGGGMLALLADQYAGPKGCWVDFFGRPASSHKAIALFTLGANATTVFSFTRRGDRPMHHVMGTEGVLDPLEIPSDMRTVTGITQWYTERLEHTIRQAPEQYWWLHRRWRDERPKRASAQRPKAA